MCLRCALRQGKIHEISHSSFMKSSFLAKMHFFRHIEDGFAEASPKLINNLKWP
jgi:hypothetical protein